MAVPELVSKEPEVKLPSNQKFSKAKNNVCLTMELCSENLLKIDLFYVDYL